MKKHLFNKNLLFISKRVLSGLFLLSTLIDLIHGFEFSYNLDFRINSKVISTRGTELFIISEGILRPVTRLPKGTKFTFRPGTTFEGKYYYSSEGEKKTIRGRYFGSILVDVNSVPTSQRSLISNLNKQKIFIYEWAIDKKNYIIKAFDKRPPYPEVIPINKSFRWERVNPQKAWTSYAANFIIQNKEIFYDSTLTDILEFCPNFASATDTEKTSFWIHLLNSLALKESAFDPMVANDESNFGSGGLDVVSRGLLQTSKNSSMSYRSYGCRFNSAEDLHDPGISITCALAIFKKWLEKDRCISCKNNEGKHRGVARYWSPLRSRYTVRCKVCRSGTATIGFRKKIISETSGRSSCKI